MVLDKIGLARYVETHDEGIGLEYKPFRDLSTCKKCDYCRTESNLRKADPKAKKGQDPRWVGVEVARAVATLADSQGGHVVIGARRVDSSTNQHELESKACQNTVYTPEMVLQAIQEFTAPLVPTRVYSPPGDGLPVFVVDVRASLSLHAWLDREGNQHIYTRHDKSSIPMDVREIELVAKTKGAVGQNAEFRGEMLSEIHNLFDCVLDRPSKSYRGLTFSGILREDPYGISCLKPELSRWPNFPQIERAVLDIPTKMAVYSTPRDLERTIDAFASLDRDLNPGPLDACELRLCAAARLLLKRREADSELFDPFSLIGEAIGVKGERGGEVWREFMQGYSVSFEEVFDKIAATGKYRLMDERTKKSSVYPLVNALSILLPLAYSTLAFYGRLREEYGRAALTLDEEGYDGWDPPPPSTIKWTGKKGRVLFVKLNETPKSSKAFKTEENPR